MIRNIQHQIFSRKTKKMNGIEENPETNTVMHTNTNMNLWHIHSIILCSLKFTIFSSFGAVWCCCWYISPAFHFSSSSFSFFCCCWTAIFFLCVWNIHLCRIFSSHASLIFFSFFCISHHIIDEKSKRMKKHVKIDRKGGANQIKYSKKWKGKFSFLFFIVSSNFPLLWIFLKLNLSEFWNLGNFKILTAFNFLNFFTFQKIKKIKIKI